MALSGSIFSAAFCSTAAYTFVKLETSLLTERSPLGVAASAVTTWAPNRPPIPEHNATINGKLNEFKFLRPIWGGSSHSPYKLLLQLDAKSLFLATGNVTSHGLFAA